MNPNEMNKLKEKAPFAFILLLLAVFIPSIFVGPIDDGLVQKDDAYKTALKKSKKALDLSIKGKEDSKRFSELSNAQGNVENILPDRGNLPEIIEEIHSKAGKNSALIRNVRYEFTREIDGFKAPSFHIQFQITANYKDFRRFIAELECLKYPLIIREIIAANKSNYSVSVQQMVKL